MPVADTHLLLPDLCRSFSLATGWRLEFVSPIESARRPVLDDDAICCWYTDIGRVDEPLGKLLLTAPEFESNCSFIQATDFASSLGQLVGELADHKERLSSRNEDVTTLVDLGMTVPVKENVAWSLTQLLRGGVQLTDSRSAVFFLLDPTLAQLRLRAAYRIESVGIPRSVRGIEESRYDLEALVHGSAVVAEVHRSDALLPDGIRSALCVAVESETMPLGTMWMYDRRGRGYTERDRHVSLSIAAQIAAVLERVALLRGSDQHHRMARELEAASQTHPAVMPTDLPEDGRYQLAAHLASCNEIGGDLCEIIALPAGRVGIAIGDATGHSVAAALVMWAARGALRANPGDERSLPATMVRLNQMLSMITPSHLFMSMCYGIFDPGSKRFTYSNAGHPVPILIRRGTVLPLMSHSLLLGVVRDTEYEQSTIDLQSGDTLVFYTDGISEARCRNHAMFRPEGIASAAVNAAQGTAREVLDAIWNRHETHIAGTDPDDDRTLVVLQVN